MWNLSPLFFIAFFISLPFSYGEDFVFTPEVKSAYENFIKLKVKVGYEQIKQAQITNPHNGLAIFIEDYGDFASLLVSEDPVLYKKLADNEDIRLNKIKKLSSQSPYYYYCQAEIKMHWAFVKLKFGDEAAAALNLKQAYTLIEKNQKDFPNFLSNKKTLGILHILIGSIPSKYLWAVNLLGFQGTVPQGRAELDQVIHSNDIFSFESHILKSLVDFFILSKNALIELHGREDNLLVYFVNSAMLLKSGENEKAIELYNSKPASQEYLDFPYFTFTYGDMLLRKGLYPQSREQFTYFLKAYHGKNYIKDCYYKLALSYWLNNEDKAAREELNNILKNGYSLSDADKHAEKLAEKKELPHKILTKARLYCDGGYYEKGLEVLKAFKPESANDKDNIEFVYRKARIFQNMGKTEESISNYLKVIAHSGNKPYYFAPNSALHLGYLYRGMKNYKVAEQYFKLALSYKNYEYKNSIENKAKAALQELKAR